MEIDAVAFDIDGTLYPNGSMYFISIPLFLTNLKFFRAFGDVRRELRKLEIIEDIYQAQTALLSEKMSITTMEAEKMINTIAYTRWIENFKKIRPYKELVSTVEQFRAAGLKTAVLSDFPLRDRLARMGLEGYWDTALSSEDSHYLKPHPKPFLLLAERLEVPPERILYVGNNYKYDVLGAQSVGMKTALICRYLNKKVKPDIVFRSYTELWEKVKALFLVGGD